MLKVASVIASVLLLAGCASAPAETVDVAPGTTVAYGGLTVGQCLSQDAAQGDISVTQAVDCAGSHFGEVMSAGTVKTVGDVFNAAKIADMANKFCVKTFEDFVGVRYDHSVLQVFPLVPSEKSWGAGDRIVTCVIYDKSGSVEGTLKGANR